MDKIFKFTKLEQIVVQFIMLTWTIIVILPFGTALLNSFKKSVGPVLRDPFGWPDPFVFSNYLKAWQGALFGDYFVNSAIISLSCVVIVFFAASTTSFVLARMPFKGSKFVFFCFLLGIMIPIRRALGPLFVIVRELNLLDSLLGIILVQSASMMPVSVFILTSFLKQVSPELEEAAKMDGASSFRIYWSVILPLVKPALATIGLLTFVQSWNEYFLPLIFLQSPENYPLTIGITSFRTQFAVQWHMMFAGLMIMMVPTIIAFLLASKQFIHGLTQGGVKE